MPVYFFIQKNEVTRAQLNCSTAWSMGDLPTYTIGGVEYKLLKVDIKIFDSVTYFDDCVAYTLEQVRNIITD